MGMLESNDSSASWAAGIRPAVAALALALAGCIPAAWGPPESPGEAVRGPAPEPRPRAPVTAAGDSSAGNPPFYEVLGERYYVMPSSTGYREEGIASWYGRKFHGRRTSSGQVYDMYAMTAAHKTLPLPTLVRVTNLTNGRSVVVTVNDRGPFVRQRIIDLSYAAAEALEMVRQGTAPVEIVALNDLRQSEVIAASAQSAGPGVPAALEPAQVVPARELFMQAGAFEEQANARALARRLRRSGVPNAFVHFADVSAAAPFRVRIGPIATVEEYDVLAERLRGLEVLDVHLVTEPATRSTANEPLPPTGGLPGG